MSSREEREHDGVAEWTTSITGHGLEGEPLTGKAATQERILVAASELFLQRGYDHTTIAQVAEHAGVSRATVFWHFSDKESLFRECFSRLCEPFRISLANHHADLPPEKRLREQVELYRSLRRGTSHGRRRIHPMGDGAHDLSGVAHADAARSAQPLRRCADGDDRGDRAARSRSPRDRHGPSRHARRRRLPLLFRRVPPLGGSSPGERGRGARDDSASCHGAGY